MEFLFIFTFSGKLFVLGLFIGAFSSSEYSGMI